MAEFSCPVCLSILSLGACEPSVADPGPHHFGKLDPDPHQSEKLDQDPDPHLSEKQDLDPDMHQK
jgi:hypothetical protein